MTGESPAANPPSGQIGDYRILREIGRGGMGVVYEAEQISLGRRVALKVLPGQVSGDRLTQERFRREARAAARLHHTNIVPVFEVGQDGDVRFYAMQFIQGQGLDAVITELRRVLHRAGSNPESERLRGRRIVPERALRQATEAPTLAEGVEVSLVLRYILTGRFDAGLQSPELVEPRSRAARAKAGGLATPAGTGREVERPDPTPNWRDSGQDCHRWRRNRPERAHPRQPCQRRPLRRQARRSCPGVPSSRRWSRVSGRSSAAWRNWPAGRRGSRLRPRTGHRAPGHQAVELAAGYRSGGLDRGFRPGQGRRRGPDPER